MLKLLISFDAADWHSSCCLHALSYYLVGGTMNKKLAFLFGMIMLAAPSSANALLISGTPTPFGQPASPTPIFGTLLDFDDGTTGTDLLFDRYLAFGITSISNTLGPSLGFHPTSQSAPNYIGTGFPNGWDADILVEFTTLQAAVGIGIAGPTTLQFELLDASMNVLEGYPYQRPRSTRTTSLTGCLRTQSSYGLPEISWLLTTCSSTTLRCHSLSRNPRPLLCSGQVLPGLL